MSLTKKLLSKVVAGAFAASLSTAALAAPVIVDLFTDPAAGTNIEDTTANGTAVVNSSAPGFASIIGGQRDIAVNLTNDLAPANPFNGIVMTIAGGTLSLQTEAEAAGTGLVQLDGDTAAGAGILLDAAGLGGVDLTAEGGNGFAFTVLESDGNYEFEIRAYTDASNYSIVRLQATQVLPGSPEQSFIPLAGFSACGFSGGQVVSVTCVGAGVDFTDLGALELFIDGTGSNVRIDLAVTGITVVPEPGSLALLAGGLLAGGFVVRRRRRSA